MKKPPLGVMPKWLYQEMVTDYDSTAERIDALTQAIIRHKAHYEIINSALINSALINEWETEISELKIKLSIKMNGGE